MSFEKRIIIVSTILIMVGSLLNVFFTDGFFFDGVYSPTEFHNDLLGLRLIVLAGLLICLIGLKINNALGKLMSILSILCILLFYALWYFEKFKWIEVLGIRKNSIEYLNKINQIGWFRGANEWDVIALIGISLFFVWTLFRFGRENTSMSV